MDRSLNVATPLMARAVFVPLSVPPDGWEPSASVTPAPDETSVLPAASSTATCTAGAKAAPAEPLPGWVTKASAAPAPGLHAEGRRRRGRAGP